MNLLRPINRSYCVLARRMELIPFSERSFNEPDYKGISKEEFTKKVNEEFNANPVLKDGYAPFCKHFFVKNFTDYQVGRVEITSDNEKLISTAYVSRTENELPVLERWISKEQLEPPVAKYLDVILYSRDQVLQESKDMNEEFTLSDGVEWGIVSIKAQDEDYETPMQPITILRNALGKKEGGSGVPLDKQKYQESVDYWSKHVLVK